MIQILNGDQRAYRGEGFSALFTFCPNCPAIISPRILGKIGAVVGVPRACQKFWGFFCLVVCSSLPDGSGRLMEGPTWQMQNVNKAEKHTPKVDAAWGYSAESKINPPAKMAAMELKNHWGLLQDMMPTALEGCKPKAKNPLAVFWLS